MRMMLNSIALGGVMDLYLICQNLVIALVVDSTALLLVKEHHPALPKALINGAQVDPLDWQLLLKLSSQ